MGNAIEISSRHNRDELKGDELLLVTGVTFTHGVRRVSNELVGAGRGGDSNGLGEGGVEIV